MSYSLAQAAAATGLNKTTLLRSIKSGRITGTKDALGQWQIDPAELHRVYPPNIAQRHAAPQAAAVLEAQHRAELAEQRLADIKTALEEMRQQRDAWQQQAERLSLPAPPPPVPKPWWKRLMTREEE